ncbi:MAG: ion transporter [Bacteroidales bacterium]|nr:ion transporter [Bacteroidales bacterium]
MTLRENIVQLADRVVAWFKSVNWGGMARRTINFIGRVMHKLLFSWLLPKKWRNIDKHRIFEVIFKSDTPAGKKFDVWLLVMIVLNILVLVADSLFGSTSTITSSAHRSLSYWLIKALEWMFTLIFTFEYYLRIYCLKQPWKYVFSFWGIIDFLSIFPSYLSIFIPATQALTVLRLLRVMRVFRIFRLDRFQTEARHLINALRNSAVRIIIFMLFVLVAAIILGTMMYSIEGKHNPAFDSVLTGIYWAVVTITTVGFGDVTPITAGGRFLAVLIMLLGYSVIAVPMGIIAGETIMESKRAKKKRNRTIVGSEYDEEEEAIKN